MADSPPAPLPPRPPTGDPGPEGMLIEKVRRIASRIVQGKAAADRWEVKAHRAIRIASILASSIGGGGVVFDRLAGNAPGVWFVLSAVALAFGILVQVANELRIEQIATEARSLADACGLIELQLGIILEAENPIPAVAQLHEELNRLLPKYHKVLPRRAAAAEVDRLVNELVEPTRSNWQFPRRQRSRKPPTPKADPGSQTPPREGNA